MQLIWVRREQKYFCKRGWTGILAKQEVICPSGRFVDPIEQFHTVRMRETAMSESFRKSKAVLLQASVGAELASLECVRTGRH